MFLMVNYQEPHLESLANEGIHYKNITGFALAQIFFPLCLY